MYQGSLKRHIRNLHSFDRSSDINDGTIYEGGSEFHISDDEANQDDEEGDEVNPGGLKQIDYCSVLVGTGRSALQRFQGASLGLEEIRITLPGQPTMDFRYLCQN